MTDRITLCWLWLVMVLGVSNDLLIRLLREEESGEELMYRLQADPSLLSGKQRERLHSVTLEQAQRVAEDCERKGIGILT